MKYVAGVAVMLLVMIGSAVIRAWGLSVLWGWFIVPAFGLPAISKLTAFGISAIAGMFTYYNAKNAQSEANKSWGEIMGDIIAAFAGIALGVVLLVAMCGIVLSVAAD
jgi:hypothetical protein